MFKLFCAACTVLAVYAQYPTTYPFENEEFVPAELVAKTPNYVFDETDDGGYIWTHAVNRNIDDYTYPFAPHTSGFFRHAFFANYGAPPERYMNGWNCTARGFVFTASDFTGIVVGAASQKVCEVGNCCSNLYDKVKFFETQESMMIWFDNLSSGGLCAGDILEIVYCESTGGHHQINCAEYYPSSNGRLFEASCYQVHMLYWMNCPVFTATGLEYGWDSEPDQYDDLLTIEQRMAVETLTIDHDHICHPYSYYYPETAVVSASTASSTSATSTDESETSTSDSSSGYVVRVLEVLLALSFLQ